MNILEFSIFLRLQKPLKKVKHFYIGGVKICLRYTFFSKTWSKMA